MAESDQSKQGGVQSPGAPPADGHDPDPRPVFDGDWAKADGKARQAHLVRVNAWRRRHPELAEQGAKGQGAEAQSRMGAGDDERAADIHALQALIDAPGTLGSDRIRAIEAKQRILARQEEERAEQEHGSLLALRDALSAMPPEQRVEALARVLVATPTP